MVIAIGRRQRLSERNILPLVSRFQAAVERGFATGIDRAGRRGFATERHSREDPGARAAQMTRLVTLLCRPSLLDASDGEGLAASVGDSRASNRFLVSSANHCSRR